MAAERNRVKKLGITFAVKGKIYRLPDPTAAAKKIDGRTLRDAVVDGDIGQMRLAFKMLESGLLEQETLDALYSLPAPDMNEIVGRWMTEADDGVSLGESSDS